jgi:hypothetical protein
MLMEMWEWLRGYHKWTQAEANIEFLKEEHLYHESSGGELHYSRITGERLVWTDARGQKHYAPLKPFGDAPEQEFADGETLAIRFNPAHPEQYYCRRLSGMRVRRAFTTTCTVIAVAAVSIGYVWTREMLGCSR